MASQEQKPRDMFRFMFQEQLRTRLADNSDSYTENATRIESGAMDAFDYVWRRYGLDNLLINPGPK